MCVLDCEFSMHPISIVNSQLVFIPGTRKGRGGGGGGGGGVKICYCCLQP